jgi:hypothetical protein
MLSNFQLNQYILTLRSTSFPQESIGLDPLDLGKYVRGRYLDGISAVSIVSDTFLGVGQCEQDQCSGLRLAIRR